MPRSRIGWWIERSTIRVCVRYLGRTYARHFESSRAHDQWALDYIEAFAEDIIDNRYGLVDD
jgi:hypothetical protein